MYVCMYVYMCEVKRAKQSRPYRLRYLVHRPQVASTCLESLKRVRCSPGSLACCSVLTPALPVSPPLPTGGRPLLPHLALLPDGPSGGASGCGSGLSDDAALPPSGPHFHGHGHMHHSAAAAEAAAAAGVARAASPGGAAAASPGGGGGGGPVVGLKTPARSSLLGMHPLSKRQRHAGTGGGAGGAAGGGAAGGHHVGTHTQVCWCCWPCGRGIVWSHE